jgi:twitching motility protein PilT
MTFHGGYRHCERFRDVFRRHIFLIPQDHNHAGLVGERRYKLLHLLFQKWICRICRCCRLRRILEADLRHTAAALIVDAPMSRHLTQPEFHVVLRLEFGQIAVELKEHILSKFLGNGPVCQKMQTNAEDHRLMLAHNVGELWQIGCFHGAFGHVSGLLTASLYIYGRIRARECKTFRKFTGKSLFRKRSLRIGLEFGRVGPIRRNDSGIQRRKMTIERNSARVQEIHSESRLPESTELKQWLRELVERNGSDLLLVPEAPASIRAEGVIAAIENRPLTGDEIEAAVFPAMAAHARDEYQQGGIADSSYRVEGLGRFRINLHRERGRAAATFRALPSKVPLLQDLHLPPGVAAVAGLQRGLVIIGGATGSGKTTTLAALVNDINQREARHIVTIEDPIEYEHAHDKSVIEQVEIGVDAPDFPTALRAAMRQAPDVIVVGEMRDSETARIALSAAETGHLVFTTLHTTDAASTVSRIADSFPQERQHTVRAEMAMALAAMLTQTLIPRRTGGRVPAAELLMVGYGARQHIRKNALQHLHQEITITRKQGSFTMEESLAQLVFQQDLLREEAMTRAIHPEDLDTLLKAKGF